MAARRAARLVQGGIQVQYPLAGQHDDDADGGAAALDDGGEQGARQHSQQPVVTKGGQHIDKGRIVSQLVEVSAHYAQA